MDILLVEDEEDLSSVYKQTLEQSGHQVTIAHDGQSAIEVIEASNFNAVLLDLGLPGFSGLEVVDSLEKTGRIKLNNIIIMTASQISSEELNNLKHKGVITWIRKPIDFELLTNILKSL